MSCQEGESESFSFMCRRVCAILQMLALRFWTCLPDGTRRSWCHRRASLLHKSRLCWHVCTKVCHGTCPHRIIYIFINGIHNEAHTHRQTSVSHRRQVLIISLCSFVPQSPPERLKPERSCLIFGFSTHRDKTVSTLPLVLYY